MEPNKESPDADEHHKLGDDNKDSEVASQMTLPPVPSFPLPPEINYSRPIPKKGVYSQSDLHPGLSGDQNLQNTTVRLGASLSAGITFASSVIVSVLIGMWIDKRFEPQSVPWATIILTILGFVAGIMNFLRISSATDPGKKGR